MEYKQLPNHYSVSAFDIFIFNVQNITINYFNLCIFHDRLCKREQIRQNIITLELNISIVLKSVWFIDIQYIFQTWYME